MLSILAMYEYDNNIFNGFRVPEGVDRDSVIDNICVDCAELDLIYTDPLTLTNLIRIWVDKEFEIWRKLYETENLEYNPIWNVDANITESETIEREKVNTSDRSITGSETNAETITNTSNNTNIDSVKGYNSNDWQEHNKSVNSGNISTSDNTAITSSGSEDFEETENEDHVRNLNTRRTGNIGVTTTQQMIKEQREVVQFNTVDYIVKSFKRRFCLLVY